MRFRIPIDRHSKNSGQSSFHLLLPLQYHTTQHYVVHVGVGGQTVHSAAERASTKRNDHNVQARLGTQKSPRLHSHSPGRRFTPAGLADCLALASCLDRVAI